MKKCGKAMVSLMALATLGGAMTGCGNGAEPGEAVKQEEVFVPTVIGTYEAEEASFTGNARAETGKSGYSGDGYATGFEQDGDECTFRITAPESGFYDLVFGSAAGGYKENYVNVDGDYLGNLVTDGTEITESELKRVYLDAGDHDVTVSKYWGWIDLGKRSIRPLELTRS